MSWANHNCCSIKLHPPQGCSKGTTLILPELVTKIPSTGSGSLTIRAGKFRPPCHHTRKDLHKELPVPPLLGNTLIAIHPGGVVLFWNGPKLSLELVVCSEKYYWIMKFWPDHLMCLLIVCLRFYTSLLEHACLPHKLCSELYCTWACYPGTFPTMNKVLYMHAQETTTSNR